MTETMLPKVHYPDSDGKPMAENTLQFEWISTVKWNLETQFHEQAEVFVAGDHLIYPVEGDATIRQAPDIYVAFGVPKGHRGSYKVFEESHIFPQVVFEVWSPSNTVADMAITREFYEHYGAEEFVIIYPDFPAHVDIWQRSDDRFHKVANAAAWTSPRSGIRFKIGKGTVAMLGPDGKVFQNPTEIALQRNEAERALLIAEEDLFDSERERDTIERERDTVKFERDSVKRERDEMQRERDTILGERDAERERIALLMAKLRQLGIDPDGVS